MIMARLKKTISQFKDGTIAGLLREVGFRIIRVSNIGQKNHCEPFFGIYPKQGTSEAGMPKIS
jgi:hypothetical protein